LNRVPEKVKSVLSEQRVSFLAAMKEMSSLLTGIKMEMMVLVGTMSPPPVEVLLG
jgi:hypothetical protein